MLLEAFRWMEVNLPGGQWLRETTYGYSSLLTIHVVGMCLFFGLILMMDLRLIGWANLRSRASEIQKRLFPWQMLGFAVLLVSGVALVWAQPLRYYGKGFFWWKLLLMGVAGVNAAVIHYLTHDKPESAWDSGAARFAGAASIVLWTGVLVTGRLISYEWYTTEYFVEDF